MVEHKEYRQDAGAVDANMDSARTIASVDLPPPNTKRWVARRKAAVVAAVRGGLISLEDACHRYSLSVEEFRSWQRMIEKHGVYGLRVTRLKEYRETRAQR